MSLVLYNTFSKKEEEFAPLHPPHVHMYTCGPTVYGRPHIGNYSSFLMADLLRRWLTVSGYQVTHVKNITDVGHLVADADEGEDKIEKQSRAEKLDPLAIAQKYTEQYLQDEHDLRLIEPEHRPRATETIKEMTEMVHILLKHGHAYETDDGVYFAVETFPAYGALSGNTVENLTAGARVGVNEQKHHSADFALWKKCVDANAHHLLRWSFATGERVYSEGEDAEAGFPGWHIECSAMSTKFLGETIDIHTGGEDNIFPHHECEIAQSECVSQKPFVRYWIHRRRIDMGAEKMSKSLGNVLYLDDIREKGYDPLDLRYYVLSVHYRTNLQFSEKGLSDAAKARKKIVQWMREVQEAKNESGTEEHRGQPHDAATATVSVATFQSAFTKAMNADLNTPEALAVVFDLMAWSRKEGQLAHCQEVASMIRETFGCFEEEHTRDLPDTVKQLLQSRAEAREQKNYAESDRLRAEIEALGYVVKDTPQGQQIL